jgi:phenylalanyl-tRNA synthetase beta chain
LPGLVENLSKNIHESYPQRLFETGTVFSNTKQISESISLAGVIGYKESNYSEMKAILQSILKIGFKIDTKTKTPKENIPMFTVGRYSNIFVGEKLIGNIGEINSNVLDNFKIRTSVVGFEIKLSGLIFD